jgi:hypothetical protein
MLTPRITMTMMMMRMMVVKMTGIMAMKMTRIIATKTMSTSLRRAIVPGQDDQAWLSNPSQSITMMKHVFLPWT